MFQRHLVTTGSRAVLTFCLLCSTLLLWTHCVRAADDGREYFALVVGVGKYPPTKFRNLPGAEPDADELARTLISRGFRKENVTVLTNSRGAADDPLWAPNTENIRREIDLLLDNRSETDVVLIALAGHGLQLKGQPYVFCPFDADVEQKKNLISIDELYKNLEKCKAEFKLLLVDACREEALAPAAQNSRAGDMLASVTRPSIPKPPGGVAAFFSCTQGQVARERTDPGPDGKPVTHGLFFHAAIRGLRGEAADANGELTLPDLEKFVKRDVETYSQVTLRVKQSPELLNQTRGLPSLLPKSVLPKEYVSKSTGMKFALIPAGEFEMGSHQSKDELVAMFAKWGALAEHFDKEFPRHRVRLTQPFYMGTHEVTQAEYEHVMGTNPSWFSNVGGGKSDLSGMETSRFPVENVSWYDVVEFCNKLSVKDGLTARYSLTGVERKDGSITTATVTRVNGTGYRLPTEAEWEYACRSGTTTAYHTGNTIAALDRAGWYGASSGPAGNSEKRTNRVGQKTANGYGLFDMHGNVSEWCEDVYDEKAYGKRGGVTADPLVTSGSEFRVLRGGSWLFGPGSARTANRYRFTPDFRLHVFGFRVVR